MKFVMFSLIGLLVLTSSCSRKPFTVLNQQDMANVMLDLYLAEAIYNSSFGGFKSDDEQKVLINSVLDKHGVTRAKFDSSLVWYSDNLEELNKINELVAKRLVSKDSIYQKKIPHKVNYRFTDLGDNLPKRFFLDSVQNTLGFRVDSAKLYKVGSPHELQLSFEILGLNTKQQQLDGRLYYRYRDTTMIVDYDSLYNKPYKIDFSINNSDSILGKLLSVEGYLHLSDSSYYSTPICLNNIKLQFIN